MTAMADDIKLPEPVAFSKDGNLFWHGNPVVHRGEDCELYTADQVRAAVEAGRARRVPLTDEQIVAVVTAAVREHRLSWLGIEKDEAGYYTVPVLSPNHYELVRAIEAAHGIHSPKGGSDA